MSYYLKSDIDKVKNVARLEDFVPGDIKRVSNRLMGKCPECGADKLQITDNSKYCNIHCFKCGFSKSGVFNVVQYFENIDFPQSVKFVADRYSIPIETEQEHRKRLMKDKEVSMEDSFCMQQLRGSGLTLEDVTAKVRTPDGKDWMYVQTFRRGTMDPYGKTSSDEDDMLIYYYNLYGSPMKVATRGAAGGLRDYVRPRWAIPEAHKDKEGKPAKYGNIRGATARFYFPGKILEAFAEKTEIPTLIIQEGEKKAEKACKHGVWSIGIQGIYNIGNKEEGLISDLQYLVKDCKIKRIVLLFDSDWNDLSRNIQPGDAIDMRPGSFARAAIKFRDYVGTLNYAGLNVDIYFGHINDNEAGDKGIDDLLCNTLRGKEELLAKDIYNTMGSVQGVGEYVSIHKISVLSDIQIMNFWDLRDKDKFFRIHADRLKDLDRVMFGRVLYVKNDKGIFEKSTMAGCEKDFWHVSYNDKNKKEVEFYAMDAVSFVGANGFARVMAPELSENKFGFARIEKGIARMVADFEIRDFVWDFICMNCKDKDVLYYIFDRLGSLMGLDKLERLKKTKIVEFYDPDSQNRYYMNGQVRITSENIEHGPMSQIIWESNRIGRDFKRIPIFKSIDRFDNDRFRVVSTKEGDRCEFLQFLINTSNFWRDKQPEELTQEEKDIIYRNLVNKITAIGYLLTDYRFTTEEKAIIAMDGKMSEVGKSNGRSGKSLIGRAIYNMTEQAFIDGKALTGSDEYMFSDVTPRTRNIFFDDVKPHFNFTRLFSALTGPLMVNPKTMARFKIDYENVPKMYVTTNHAIDDDSNSAKDRMVMMIFSDWYRIDYKPIQEFGHPFFSGWDDTQWNLFDNLMAECVMYYLRSRELGWTDPGCGVVHPPESSAELRQLRQKMGEVFLQWAELYYGEDSVHLNERINVNNIYSNFCEDCPGQQKFVSKHSFREKIQAFCKFAGLHFNPHKKHKETKDSFSQWRQVNRSGIFIGERDSSGGVIYFTVATDDFALKTCM
ncbi:DUF3854 domain-containing protein [bacterium]|nr:DUF3854 domain-containing protein [bacterium]